MGWTQKLLSCPIGPLSQAIERQSSQDAREGWLEESQGVHFYTMQLVKGQTLTELISKSGLPLNKLFEKD